MKLSILFEDAILLEDKKLDEVATYYNNRHGEILSTLPGHPAEDLRYREYACKICYKLAAEEAQKQGRKKPEKFEYVVDGKDIPKHFDEVHGMVLEPITAIMPKEVPILKPKKVTVFKCQYVERLGDQRVRCGDTFDPYICDICVSQRLPGQVPQTTSYDYPIQGTINCKEHHNWMVHKIMPTGKKIHSRIKEKF